MDLDKILLEQDVTYEKIKDFISAGNEDNYYKILLRISRFPENDIKIICKEIINNSNTEDVIDMACMYIITFIQYDYDYYKEIINITSIKNIEGTWNNEIKDKLLDDSKKTIVNVFEDFSKKNPKSISYDIKIITRLLDKYDEKYIKSLKIEKKKIIEICKRINYIMTINVKNILKLFYSISCEYKLNSGEISLFLDIFLKNYPSVCMAFIKEDKNYDLKTIFIKELKNKVKQQEKEEKIKYDMEIFKPDIRRMNEYRKIQFKQNKEINKLASKKSIIGSLCKSDTILYGGKYGLAVETKDSKEISVGSLHELKYEYPYPIEYLVDPVEYVEKINSLKNLGRGKSNETNT